MPDPVRIVFLGNPVAKGRPRFTKNGHAYTPAKTRAAETNLRYEATRAMADREPLDQPVGLSVSAEFDIPKSWSKKKKNAAILGLLRHGNRPDVDNIVKQVKDALNGVVYRDDKLVCELHAQKLYSKQPRLIIQVTPL